MKDTSYRVNVEKSQAGTPFDGFLGRSRFVGRAGWTLCLVAEPLMSTPFSATAILLRDVL
jgi:hypothetical protein